MRWGKLELCRILHRQIGGLFALKDTPDVVLSFRYVGSVQAWYSNVEISKAAQKRLPWVHADQMRVECRVMNLWQWDAVRDYWLAELFMSIGHAYFDRYA
jgi:hypothetical protein